MTQPVMLDGGDRRCVQLLIELRRLILTVPAGTVVHLIATDPAAPLDLPAWCHLTGNTYCGQIQLPAAGRPTYAMQVTGGAVITDPTRPWRPATTEIS